MSVLRSKLRVYLDYFVKVFIFCSLVAGVLGFHVVRFQTSSNDVMLSLILPPIGVVLCAAFLAWLFLKKRSGIQFHLGEKNIFQIITPPKRRQDAVSEQGQVDVFRKPSLGVLVIQIVKSFLVWLKNIIVERILHRRRDFVQGVKFSKIEQNDQMLGVSSVVGQDPERKGLREISVEAVIPPYDKRIKRRKREYFKGRPMISDKVTLPQKKDEKDRYEQVLIERIALNPRDVEAYERLGDYYMENGNFGDAKECFKQVLRLSPLSRRARFRMRRVEKSLSGR